MTTTETPKSTGAMMSDIMGHVGKLVRNEADLACAEIKNGLGKVVASLGIMALAVALGIAGLNLVATSLVALAIWVGLTTVLEDFIPRDKIFHFDHNRSPKRVVHARGYGAHGIFTRTRAPFPRSKASGFTPSALSLTTGAPPSSSSSGSSGWDCNWCSGTRR